jgi:putative SOS response-associated peptidase YedK
MCGRYTITRQKGLVEDLEAFVDPSVERNPMWKARFNVAPTQDAPVVTLREGIRTLEMKRWGLVPFWAGKEGAKPPLMINARVETLQQKPMFRDALARGRRCLVPADGFYEWKKLDKKHKQPMWIHPTDGSLFAFAGLYAKDTFTIITGPPNDLVAPIHDRMPVILPRASWNAWLDPDAKPDAALALLDVPGYDGWSAQPVSSRVNVADNDDEACIAAITDESPTPPRQGSLF